MNEAAPGADDAAAHLNQLPTDDAARVLHRCCGSHRWVREMLQQRPFASVAALHAAASEAFRRLSRDDYLEAFSHHPTIGANARELAAQEAGSAALSRVEQAGVAQGDASTRSRLREANLAYSARFGFVFLVCATGKGADEMLSLLRARLDNDPATELTIAATELAKITHLRLASIAR